MKTQPDRTSQGKRSLLHPDRYCTHLIILLASQTDGEAIAP
ncbi:hypothetical protein [Trichocoleus sp. DQ-U1]